MRKNKFVNPSQRFAQSSFQLSPNKSQNNHPLIQNKIYFPVSFVDKLMPYKFQCPNPIKSKTDKMYSSQLYEVKEKNRSQQKREKRSGFKRENKFEKVKAQPTIDSQQNRSKSLIKNNTIELKKLPGISCTASGTTIYRSKNIKSMGKFVFERSLTKRGKPQLRRNLSVRNEESIESSILSNKQATLKSKDNKAFLYKTYFSTKPSLNQRSNSQTPIFHELFYQDGKQEFVENPEDQLCTSLIRAELYSGLYQQEQQQFF